MQESHITVIIRHSSGTIKFARLGIKPAFGMELRGVGTPDSFRTVDGPGRDVDACSFWDGLAADGSGPDGDAQGYGNGGVEAEDFGGDGIEEGEAFEDGGQVDCWV